VSRYRVIIHKKALRKLKDIPRGILKKIIDAIDELENTPIPWRKYDIRKICGLKDFYRIRVGAYRVIYFIDWKSKTIKILKIEKRGESTYKL